MDFAFAAPLGLLIGSFLNVVAYRLPRGESLVKPRSRCTSCGEEVRPYDNVPNGLNEELLLSLPFAAMLIAVADIDIEHRIVPNKILLPMAVWGIGAGAFVHLDALPEMLIAGAAAFTALLLAALAYPGGMGMGDVKLAGVMGLYLGASVIPALLAAFLFGSLVGIAIVLRHGADARKKAVPFAPFLALGGLLGLLAGPELIDLYTRTFL
jgi:leader peptidase (prepilin peptidase)/N-methyltransferase